MGPIPFSTPFRAKIINTPRYSKVKMSPMDLYDGTKDPEEYLGVYKAQIYIQDIDNILYCRYIAVALKGVAQSWLKSLTPGAFLAFKRRPINSLASSSVAVSRGKLASTYLKSS